MKNSTDIEFMNNRAILAGKNIDVNKINEMASNYFPGINIFIRRLSFMS